jgi:hypothetical protein
VWRHTTTQKRSLSLKQYCTDGRPPGCAMLACAYRACSCADGQAASTQARLHCAVRREPREARRVHSGCQLRRCKRRQGAAPRSCRPRLQEQELWSARGEAGAAARRGRRRAHDMASPTWPRPHARLGCGAERRGIETLAMLGIRPRCRSPSLALPAPAGRGSPAINKQTDKTGEAALRGGS